VAICGSCCFAYTSQAQSVYNARFNNPIANCIDNTFCSTLQLKAAEGEADFAIGSFTLFFSFDSTVINHPVTYTAINFDNFNACNDFGGASYYGPAYTANQGYFNLTVNMYIPNQGCPLITTTDWIDVGEVCFSIITYGGGCNLNFLNHLTLINLNANLPEHIQGDLFSLDMPVLCLGDTDSDGLSDDEELSLGTSLENADTDSDGLSDFEELEWTTNPLLADTDSDGLSDGQEALVFFTNPLLVDTDSDGLVDGAEVFNYGTNPLLADSDSDGLTDEVELNLGSNPNDADTDDDGLVDGLEVVNGDAIDTDNDGVLDYLDIDDDNDGLPTLVEDVNANGNYTDDDWDVDGLPDYLDSDLSPLGLWDQTEAVPSVKIGPNPVANYLWVTFLQPIVANNCTFSMYNTKGQLMVQQVLLTNNTSKVPVFSLPDGVYVVSIKGVGFSTQQKVLKY